MEPVDTSKLSAETNAKINDILDQAKESLPNNVTFEITQSFVNSVEKSLSEPIETWNETMTKNSVEKIINTELFTGSEDDGIEPIKLSVSVNKAKYGNYLYYNIKCDTPLEKDNAFCIHPFRLVADRVEDNHIGEVTADNEMIRKMFEFIIMPDEELRKRSGTTSVVEYRAMIIQAINLFWD